jgi:ParB family chromosome partitioning protein
MSDELDTSPDVADDIPAPKTRGLGRGLNALFEDEEVYRQPEPSEPRVGNVGNQFDAADDVAFRIYDEDAQAEKDQFEREIQEVDTLSKRILSLGVEQIIPNAGQPRKVFDDEALNDLAESIGEHGIIQPILVRESAATPEGCYELVAGERRWRAAQVAQLHVIPAIVIEEDEARAYEISLIENLQREQLNPIEEASGYNNLMYSHDYTQADIAQKVGKSRSHVANMLRLMKLPFQAQVALSDGRITMGHGRAILSAENPDALFKEVLASNLSVRETEKRAAESTGREVGRKKSGPSKKSKVQKDVNTIALEKDLSEKLGMAVALDVRKGGAGALKINYQSLDQLDDIISRLYSERDAVFSAGDGGGSARLND